MALELGHWSGMIVLVEWPVVQVVETTNHINQIQSVISITVMAMTMTSLVGVNPLVFFLHNLEQTKASPAKVVI